VTEPVQHYCFLGNKDIEFAPGVELIYIPGHCAGLMGLIVHLEKETYIFPIDSLNMAQNYVLGQAVGIMMDSKAAWPPSRKYASLRKNTRPRSYSLTI
jgi:hypothetical protein